jgi:hypothetical protein
MYETERERAIADLRARIADLRSRLAGDHESLEGTQTRQEIGRDTTEVEESLPYVGQNDEQREKRNSELEMIKKKLMGKKV